MNPHTRPSGPFFIRIPNIKKFRFAAFLLSAFSLLPVTGWAENNQNPKVAKCPFFTMSMEGVEENKKEDPEREFLIIVNQNDGLSNVKIIVKRAVGSDAQGDIYAQATAKLTVKGKYKTYVDNELVNIAELNKQISVDKMDEPFVAELKEITLNNSNVSSDSNTSCEPQRMTFGYGCSSCGCSDEPNPTSGTLRMSMGDSFQGDSNSSIEFKPVSFLNQGPSLLKMPSVNGYTINRDSSGVITSVSTEVAEAVVSPVTSDTDPNAFKVEFKHKSGGVTGNPYRIVTFENIVVLNLPVLRISINNDGVTKNYDYSVQQDQSGQYDSLMVHSKADGQWRSTLLKKELADGSGRVERVKFESKLGNSYIVESDVEETFTYFPGVERKTKEVVDPGGAALVTKWEYYPTGEVTGPLGSMVGQGRTKRMIRYDGYEETYYYATNMETTVSSYAGDSQGVTTVVAQNPLAKITTTTRSVGGNVISQSVEIHGENTVTSRKNGNASNNLQTVTEYYPIGQDFGRKVKKITNPDETVTIYEYSRVGGTKTTTTYQGVPGDSNISEGTKTVSVVNARGQEESQITTAVGTGNGIVLSHWVVLSSDAYGRPLSIGHFPDGNGGYAYTTSKTYSCCGLATETDQYGVTTTYAYDDFKRVVKTNRLGVSSATVYNGLTVSTHRYPETSADAISPDLRGATAENLISKTVTVPNTAGTKTEIWTRSAADGSLICSSVNTIIYLNPASDNPASLPAGIGRRQVVQTADNFTQTTDSYKDGKTYETFGDLSPTTRHAYSVNAIGEVSSQSYVEGANLRETTTLQSDRLGRNVSATKGTITQTNTYNSRGQLEKSTDADGVSTLYAYNAKGERTTTAIDINGNDRIDFDGTDRITVSTNAPGTYSDYSVMSQTNQVYATNGSGIATIIATSYSTPDGLQSWSISAGVSNPTQSITVIGTGGAWTETTTNPDSTKTISTYTDGRLISTEYHSSLASSSLLSSVSYGYDSLGRRVTSTDSRAGTTTTAYVSATCDSVQKITAPGNRDTKFGYDSRGRRIIIKLPDNTVTNTSYYPDGQVKATWGSQAYPTFTTYDYVGRQKTLRTQPTLASGIPTDAGGSVTTWNYSTTTGQLLSKLDDAGKGAIYSYTPAGRLATRTWGRSSVASPMVTIYTYDTAGQLTTTDYSDTTPDVTVTHNRLGQPWTITQFKQSKIEYAYDPVTQAVDTEAISYDIDHDGNYEFTRVLDRAQDTKGRSTGFQLKDGTTIENRADYAYSSTDGQLQSISGGGSQPPSAANTFTYHYLANSNLIEKISGPIHDVNNAWEPNRDVLASKQNKVGTTVVSQYVYTVNAIGQRTNLATSGSAFPNVPSWLWGYDSFGQLISADSNVNTSDRAYQYDTIGNRQRATAGTLDVNDPVATLYTANGLNQYSKITSNSVTSNPLFDVDGNMTSAPLPAAPASNSALVWDAENRLVSVTVGTTATTYLYDAESRRIAVTTGGNTTLFIYDGFNCIAEYSGTTLSKTRLWGIDLSGSLQSAGGVGGLLVEKQGSNIYYPLFDGNGNVSEYINSAGAVVSHFEYDPFGNVVVNSDSGNLFNYRFSTKPLDFVTGLYYYQYRYYDPLTGRWSSRDPIDEEGGVNLYGFVGNDVISETDLLGLSNVPLIPFNYDWALSGCETVIWVGHGSYIWEAVTRTIKATVESGVKTAKVGFLSCLPKKNLRDIRKLIKEHGGKTKNIKSDMLLDFGLPDVEMTNSGMGDPYDVKFNALEWIITAHRIAVVEAMERCKKCNCDQITIKTQLIGQDEQEQIDVVGKDGKIKKIRNPNYSPFVLNFTYDEWKPYFMDIIVPCNLKGWELAQ